jgi:hypothetical protein
MRDYHRKKGNHSEKFIPSFVVFYFKQFPISIGSVVEEIVNLSGKPLTFF